jgi:lincosamide nucleotidyltransferase A/C/D/E
MLTIGVGLAVWVTTFILIPVGAVLIAIGATKLARRMPRHAFRSRWRDSPVKNSRLLSEHAAVYVGCMTMTEADVVEVLGWLGEREIAVWLDGGWGVDALVGEQMRDHKDLDLIVRDDHVSRMSELLHEHGFRLSRGVQGGFVLRDERGRVVDVHPVRFDDRGNGHFESEDRAPFDHPAAAFAAAGNIAGRRVTCLRRR